jgi:class 3 adenylate cyclase
VSGSIGAGAEKVLVTPIPWVTAVTELLVFGLVNSRLADRREGMPMTQQSEQDAAEPVSRSEVGPSRKSASSWRGRLLFNRVSIQSKLIVMLVLCTFLAATVVGAIAFQSGRDFMRISATNRLVEIRELQKRALETEVIDLKAALLTSTRGDSIETALRAFTAGFDQLANAPISPEQSKALADYYRIFVADTEKYSGITLDAASLLPTSNAARYLQYFYTSKLAGDDVAIVADDQRDGSAWSAANAKYQDFFREIVQQFAFEDALLIDDRGNIVYTAYKNIDLGSNILTGAFNGSKLRGAYQEAMSSNKTDRVVLTDFEFYEPATAAPTAWMVAPIPASGKPEGALAFQFPITKINKLMTFDKQWSEVGMGQTGETILGGEDYLMRSDSRLFLEDPEKYRQMVIAAGTPPEIPDIAIRQGGTTLVQPVAKAPHQNALEGRSGTMIATDYLGQETVQAYTPVDAKESNLHWSLVAKINTAEAFAREATFTRIVVLATTFIILVVCLLAAFLARIFVRPIRRLEAGVQRISGGDFDVELPIETRDEIGDLTAMFNTMSRSLAVKDELVSQQRTEIRNLLNSLMPEPFAEKFSRGEEISARTHTNVSVVFADIEGLDRLQAELDPAEALLIASELIRQFDAAAADFDVERVRTVRNGYLGSCGLTLPRLDNAQRTVNFALECQRIVERLNGETGTNLQVRAGIDIGTINSGLIGRQSLVYDLWGAAVNLAFQIKDDAATPGIYITSRVYDALTDTTAFAPAGTVETDDGSQTVWRLSERR